MPPIRRQPSSSYSSYSIGPGPVSTAIKALIGANVVMFVLQSLSGEVLTSTLGLSPWSVIHRGAIWQLATYMFLHGGVMHLLFNMLALWMFGSQLERTWGTRYFLKFYFVAGIGAAALTVFVSLLPFGFATDLQRAIIIGASGAIYGLLIAFALYFPDTSIYYIVFPIPAKYFVMIVGVLALYFSIGDTGGVANATHLGGLLVGYLYLKGARFHPFAEVKYRYVKWKIGRVRKKFDVYSGGRGGKSDWNRRVH